jgi:nucleoside-diphosphate-sugar epimerase
VTALDLPGCDPRTIDVSRVSFRPGDIRDTALVQDLVRLADVIVNVASVHTEGRTEHRADAMEQVNAHAAVDLYDAAVEAGADHFIQLSTGAVAPTGPTARDENASPAPRTSFERTKLAADEALLRRSAEVPVTVLRPALVVGPGRRTHMATLAAAPAVLAEVTSRLPRLAGGPRISWVHTEDVARAVCLLVAQAPPPEGVFHVAAPQPASLGELLDALADAADLERSPIQIPYPNLLARALAPVLSAGAPLIDGGLRRSFSALIREHGLRDSLEPVLPRTAMRRATESRVLDTSRLEALGFEAEHTDLDEAWASTVRWYREHRWLP